MTRREPRSSSQSQAAIGRADDTVPVPTVDPREREPDSGEFDDDDAFVRGDVDTGFVARMMSEGQAS